MGKEFNEKYFDSGTAYDSYLAEKHLGNYFGRAIGVRCSKGGEIIIDKSYYLSGGIKEEQLAAIVLHEKIELTSKSKNAHLKAMIGEYQFILEQFGVQELNQCHCNLCNLIGGDNSIRSQALSKVLQKHP